MKYWDRAYSLVDGCTPCSPGCDHCWAASWAHRFIREGEPGHTNGVLTDENGRFNGAVVPRRDRLEVPLHRKKPTVYCVWNDLFHEDVPGTFIQAAYATMAQARQHTFLVLTKRARRMSDLTTAADEIGLTLREGCRGFNLPNVWHGLTVCNQEEAYNKLSGWSISVPGKKFISIEPMLGPIDLDDADPEWWCDGRINAVILGGETGPKARPMQPDWVRKVRDDCAAVGVKFLFKQWGEWITKDKSSPSDEMYPPFTRAHCWNPDVIPPYPFYRDWAYRVGRNKAGRLLDGRTHDDMPWRT